MIRSVSSSVCPSCIPFLSRSRPWDPEKCLAFSLPAVRSPIKCPLQSSHLVNPRFMAAVCFTAVSMTVQTPVGLILYCPLLLVGSWLRKDETLLPCPTYPQTANRLSPTEKLSKYCNKYRLSGHHLCRIWICVRIGQGGAFCLQRMQR